MYGKPTTQELAVPTINGIGIGGNFRLCWDGRQNGWSAPKEIPFTVSRTSKTEALYWPY